MPSAKLLSGRVVAVISHGKVAALVAHVPIA